MTEKETCSGQGVDPSQDSAGSPQADSKQALRQQAEAIAREKAIRAPEHLDTLSPEEARRVLHELQVHQIELEMQNEELRRTQEELEASRTRYFDLYDLAPVGYFTLSEHGLVLEANLTAAKLLGVARGSLVKQPLSRFILPEDQDIHYRHRKQLVETGTPQVWELRLLRKDAAPFWARVQATMAQDADGATVYRAVVSDIAERKRAEEALNATNDELRNFAYALTHDLREPLRMVVNFTQLLAQESVGKLGEDADKYISYCVEGALRIEALLKALSDYWEVTERGGERLSPVDCNHALSQALLHLQTAIEESGATVTSDPLPTVVAEDAMLVQVFQNLIGNSIKYRGEPAPRIHVTAVRTAEGWLFSVRDNGIGIDPEHADHVFGMFKRLHGREIPGTGIGLALCRKVVERRGGRIWVESEAGRGADFKFTIPIGMHGGAIPRLPPME
ncbi:MAG: sensor histidine kinase [Bryobacteraceae bacterium]